LTPAFFSGAKTSRSSVARRSSTASSVVMMPSRKTLNGRWASIASPFLLRRLRRTTM
jgi:hypothetical protein